MNFSLGYAFNLRDIFRNLNLSKLKISSKECENLIHDKHRDRLAARILRAHMKMVFEDMIENNITFLLPTGPKKADIHMKVFQGDEFKRCRMFGKFMDIDFLKTYFTAYQPCLFLYSNNRTRVKPIYLNERLRKRLTQKTNEGMKYC